jgi:hypothetical protein
MVLDWSNIKDRVKYANLLLSETKEFDSRVANVVYTSIMIIYGTLAHLKHYIL